MRDKRRAIPTTDKTESEDVASATLFPPTDRRIALMNVSEDPNTWQWEYVEAHEEYLP